MMATNVEPSNFVSPPVVDFSGENLNESGLSIKQVKASSQPVVQAKYVANRKTVDEMRTKVNDRQRSIYCIVAVDDEETNARN